MKPILIITGSVLLLLGLLSWLTPLPGGTALIAIGLMLLICTSETAARIIMNGRLKITIFNKAMIWIEDHVPAKFSDALRRTRPAVD